MTSSGTSRGARWATGGTLSVGAALASFVVLVVLPTLGLAWATTTVSARTCTYDVSTVARVDLHEFADAPAAPTLLRDVQEGLLPPSLNDRGTSTTPFALGHATEAGAPAIKAGAADGATAGQRFPTSVRNAALEENPSTCVYCRMETDAPQVDHAIPRSRGGDATIENAQTTCGHCNASKGARDFPVTPPSGYRGPWPPPWWDTGG